MRLIKLFFILLFILVSCVSEDYGDKPVIVSIIKEENSKKFNAIEKGLIDQISLDKLNVKINFYTSKGDDASIIEIANNVREDNSSIAVVIGEEAVLLSMNIIVPQSILFAGCFDNLSLASIEKSRVQNNNITGVYGNLDITKYLKIISESGVNSLGYLYSKNSEVSENISEYLAKYCSNESINYYPIALEADYTINDIENIISSLDIDYLFIAKDDYINDNIYNIDHLCRKYSIPIINTDIENALNADILFSLDCNYYYLGRKLAELLKDVIDNEGSTDSIDFIEVSDSYRVLINEDTAKLYRINFTEEILKDSYFVIEDKKVIRR